MFEAVNGFVHYSRLKYNMFIVDGLLISKLSEEEAKTTSERLNLFYKKAGFKYPKFFKMDPLCKAGMLCLMPFADYLHAHPKGSEGGLLVFTDSGCRMADEEHLRLMRESATSPAVFVYTLPNIVLGEWSIFSRWVGYGQCFLINAFKTSYLAERISAFKADFPGAPVLAGWLSVSEDSLEGMLFICSEGMQTEQEIAKQISDIYHL